MRLRTPLHHILLQLAKRLSRDLVEAQDHHLKFMGPPCLEPIVIELVLESEVARHIQGLKGASSSGPD